MTKQAINASLQSDLNAMLEYEATAQGVAGSGDYVVCLGAGNITQWAYALPDQLAAGDAL